MHIRDYSFLQTLFMVMVFLLLSGRTCRAEEIYEDPNTGYHVVVADECELLSESEKIEMMQVMKEIAHYGNVGFVSTDEAQSDRQTKRLAKERYKKYFGNTAGTLFYIDKQAHSLYIYTYGEIKNIITGNYTVTIIDNAYQDANVGNYGACAIDVYKQELKLLQGKRIVQPMKYISNTLLGIAIGFLLTFMWVLRWYKKHMPQTWNKMELVLPEVKFTNTQASEKFSEKTYYPQGDFHGRVEAQKGFNSPRDFDKY